MKKIFKKQWPLLGIGALILFVAVNVFLAQRGFISGSDSSEKGGREGFRFKDIHYEHSDPDAKVTWLLDALEVTTSKDRRFMSFRNFRLQVRPQDKSHVELTGENAEYDRETGEVVLQGDLKGKTDNGYTFETESAVYNQKKGDLRTDEPVVISGPMFFVRGRGMSFDVNRKILRIHSDVTTSVKREILAS